jgi:hypothetical protein
VTAEGEALLGTLRIRGDAREVLAADGGATRLTRCEAHLLRMLLPGEVVSRRVACAEVLGREMDYGDRSIDVLACKLRQKLLSASRGEVRVLSERGYGYRLALDQVPVPVPVAVRARIVSLDRRRAEGGGRVATVQVELCEAADEARFEPGQACELIPL